MYKILLSIGVCIWMLNSGCNSKKVEGKEHESTFIIINPIRKDTSIQKDYVCQIHSYQHIELRSQERGYVEQIYVDEGDFVKKGQLLFQIMPKLYRAEVEKAKAEAKIAEIEYQNTLLLADNNVVSPNELAMSKAKWDRAKAELSLAEVHLGFTEIRAPFDGIIDRFHVRQGSLVEEGDILTHLSDNSKMWVYFNVPEAEYLEYMGQLKRDSFLKVKLIMANNQPFKYEGIVETIEADFNNETGNIPFRATFQNPDRLLRHGETGNVVVSENLTNALLIPQKATFEILEERYVYIVDEQNVVHMKPITIGAELPHLYAVVEGLQEDDKILLEGLRKVKENQKIHFRLLPGEKVLNHLDLYAE